ncbi:hypothetical protein CAPN004_02500 [Capnocytophaga cynodegmi]|uniref:ribosomal maturation YjgA family protein n=1 Tax=Capnocytophaga cynodegmi TaxID=28189 RepID=UPI001AC02F24|nr:DUF2809 domain-containing protein [Capnocytophaga cynodegmi]GIM51220.1 hypothetical protein CAPN004_02500 [Capnocytophaga cynodegmi]
MKFQFNKKYFLQAVSLFLIEVLIATIFRKIHFLRAYVGDILVVMLIYTFVLSFLKVKNKDKLLVGIFLFAVAIEILQFFKIAELLGFSKGSIGYILMGNYFSWEDIICYAVGCILLKIFNSK